MDTKDSTLAHILEDGIQKSLHVFEENSENTSLSDLFLHFNRDSNTLFIYDDMENPLGEIAFEEEPHRLNEAIRNALVRLEKQGAFNRDFIFKPFTANLVDENFLIRKELIFIDDSILQVDDNIWGNMEKELDSFLKNLLNN